MKRIVTIILISICFLLATACDNKSNSGVKLENNINSAKVQNDTNEVSSSTAASTNSSSKNAINNTVSNTTNTGQNTDPKKNSSEIGSTETSNISSDINSFIPKGWHILERVKGQPAKVEGDLNNDGINDVAMVIEGTSTTQGEAAPRSLMILLGNKNKSYSLSVTAQKAVLLSNEGGVFGDPFENITIDRGSVLLSFYGGSNYRWFNSYRFRFQDNGWYLIGATIGSYYDATRTRENADTEDYNLLTGDYIFKNANDKGELITTKGNRGKKNLVNLKDFRADSLKNQF